MNFLTEDDIMPKHEASEIRIREKEMRTFMATPASKYNMCMMQWWNANRQTLGDNVPLV